MHLRPLLLFSLLLSLSLFFDLPAEPSRQKVLWVPLQGTVELGLAPYIKRAVEKAEAEDFDLLILDIDTFGGRVDAAVQIRDALLDSKVASLAYINRRAISAGALISLATDKIYFSPGATMGAATPVQAGGEGVEDVSKKYVSYFRSEMAATAEQKGWPKDIAAAMVQAEQDIKDLVKEGEVLTLTSEMAVKVKMANGIADSEADLFSALEMTSPEVIVFEINWAERIVRFLTDPSVSGLLMSGGILGLILELQSPGFGLPGIIGVSCLSLFFFGKFIVQLAGWEEVLLFIAGFLLLILEFFLLPGTFFLAAAGVICIFTALFLAGVSPQVPFSWDFPSVQEHVNSMSFAILALVVGLGIVYWILSKAPNRVPLVLSSELAHGSGQSDSRSTEREALLGKLGTTLTSLAPSGKVEIAGEIYDAISNSPYIERGVSVEVLEADPMKLIVGIKRNT